MLGRGLGVRRVITTRKQGREGYCEQPRGVGVHED
jgi:hypothetical protein